MLLFAWVAAITIATVVIGAALSWLILRTSKLRALRIQERACTPRQFRERLGAAALNVVLLLAPAAPAFVLLERIFLWPWPGAGMFCAQLFAMLFIDDSLFYFSHRAQHRSKLLYRVHARHHQAFAPLPLDFIYVHPMDLGMGSAFSAVAAACVYFAVGSISVPAFLAYTLIRNMHQLLIHSGLRWPLVAPHDRHHSRSDGNYASMFPLWDRLLGTRIDVNRTG